MSDEEQAIISKINQQTALEYDAELEQSMYIDDKKILVGVYGVLVRKDKVLLVRTQSGSQSIYNFPQGRFMGIHQTVTVCLLRECTSQSQSLH